MRVFLAVMMAALLAGPAYAQAEKPIPRYGDTAKEKSPQEKDAEKEAERAYQRSLGNIPNQGPTDPWGNVRSDGAPKPAAKTSPAKRAKVDGAAK